MIESPIQSRETLDKWIDIRVHELTVQAERITVTSVLTGGSSLELQSLLYDAIDKLKECKKNIRAKDFQYDSHLSTRHWFNSFLGTVAHYHKGEAAYLLPDLDRGLVERPISFYEWSLYQEAAGWQKKFTNHDKVISYFVAFQQLLDGILNGRHEDALLRGLNAESSFQSYLSEVYAQLDPNDENYTYFIEALFSESNLPASRSRNEFKNRFKKFILKRFWLEKMNENVYALLIETGLERRGFAGEDYSRKKKMGRLFSVWKGQLLQYQNELSNMADVLAVDMGMFGKTEDQVRELSRFFLADHFENIEGYLKRIPLPWDAWATGSNSEVYKLSTVLNQMDLETREQGVFLDILAERLEMVADMDESRQYAVASSILDAQSLRMETLLKQLETLKHGNFLLGIPIDAAYEEKSIKIFEDSFLPLYQQWEKFSVRFLPKKNEEGTERFNELLRVRSVLLEQIIARVKALDIDKLNQWSEIEYQALNGAFRIDGKENFFHVYFSALWASGQTPKIPDVNTYGAVCVDIVLRQKFSKGENLGW